MSNQITYRPLEYSDLKAVCSLLNDEITTYHLTVKHLISRIVMDIHFDFEHFIGAFNGGVLVGFIYFALRSNTSRKCLYIPLFFVKREYRNQGVGTCLLLKIPNSKKIILAKNSPNYIYPGVPKEEGTLRFFSERGFKCEQINYAMTLKLDKTEVQRSFSLTKKLAQNRGLVISCFEDNDLLELLLLIDKNFSASWKQEIINAYLCGKIYRDVLLLRKDKMIIGYCQRGIDHNSNRFGPFGIDVHYRNQGLGGILFDYMAYKLLKEGEENLFFLSTDISGKRFYFRKGFELMEEYYYLVYEKGMV